jgi:hypothetical protein
MIAILSRAVDNCRSAVIPTTLLLLGNPRLKPFEQIHARSLIVMLTSWPHVSVSESLSMPSPKITRSESARMTRASDAPRTPSVMSVPVAIDGQASRTNQHSRASGGLGNYSALWRSSQADRHHPVAPVPVPMSMPEDDCRSTARLAR